jgi:hypothetical protein
VRTTLTRAQWRDVLASAISAPSVLNTQPWSFTVRDNRVELHADKDRQLQVLDPHGRQLLMSCGAALLNLRLAIVQRTRDPGVRLLPEPTDPLHVATVTIGRSRTPTPDESELFAAIPRRRTNRRPFSPEPPPTDALTQLQTAAEAERRLSSSSSTASCVGKLSKPSGPPSTYCSGTLLPAMKLLGGSNGTLQVKEFRPRPLV